MMNGEDNENAPQTEDTRAALNNSVGAEGDGNQDNDDGPSFGNIFYTKKPKHAAEGLGQGVGNAIKGVVGGTAIFLGAPVAGFVQGKKEGGGWGAVKGGLAGLGMGVIGGVSMAASGVAVGAYQVARGVANTPGSISAQSKGCDWDPETRKWVLYDLKVEAATILSMSDEDFLRTLNEKEGDKRAGGDGAEGPLPQRRPVRSVADKEYYNILDVPTNATSGEIKKAYYKKAKQNHPDRHPDDPEAHAKFQKIGQAYQVLSDDKLREDYDARGKDGVDGAPKLDPGTMFAMIFGSDKFVPLVGELKLASQMQAKEDDVDNPQLDKFHQKKREIQCAIDLATKLQSYIDFDENAQLFREMVTPELVELSNTAFGKTLVRTIGSMYKEEAVAEMSALGAMNVGMQQAGRGFLRGGAILVEGASAAWAANEMNKAHKEAVKRSSIGDKASTNAAQADAAAAAAAAATDADAAAAGADSKEGEAKLTAEDEEVLQKKMEKLSGHMFSVMWHFTEIDIRSTLAAVVKKVTHDHSVEEDVRKKRCRGLKLLGEIFLEYGGSMEDGLAEVKSRLQSQMKAQKTSAGSETSDDGSSDSGTQQQKSAPPKPSKPAAAKATPSADGDLD